MVVCLHILIGGGELMIKLPKDLKRNIIRKICLRFLALAVMLAASVFVIFRYGDALSTGEDHHFWFGIAFKGVMLLIPFVVSGVPLKLFDTTFSGKIMSVKIKDVLDTMSKTTINPSQLYYRPDATLLIDTTDGRVEFRKISGGKKHPEIPIDLYAKGKDVFHLYGSHLTVVMPGKDDLKCQCAVCGYWNDVENERCAVCSHTLIKTLIYPEK